VPAMQQCRRQRTTFDCEEYYKVSTCYSDTTGGGPDSFLDSFFCFLVPKILQKTRESWVWPLVPPGACQW